MRLFLMFGGHSFNENPPYFAYPGFFICYFRISYQKYTYPSKNDMFLMLFDFFVICVPFFLLVICSNGLFWAT